MKTIYKGQQIEIDLQAIPVLCVGKEALTTAVQILENEELGKVVAAIANKVQYDKDPTECFTKSEKAIYDLFINNICRFGAQYAKKMKNLMQNREKDTQTQEIF